MYQSIIWVGANGEVHFEPINWSAIFGETEEEPLE